MHTAEIEQKNSVSAIWLIPIIALTIGLWMVFDQWRNQGPLINIQFNSAAGLEIKKTRLKTRDVNIGEVEDIQLMQDSDGVIIYVRVDKQAEHLLREDSQFWVVSPRITHNGISGLNTLLSGSYIEMAPGKSSESKNQFEGRDEPPVTAYGTPGLHITLNSNDEFAFSAGDPVVYKGLTVGRIEDIYFNFYERVVYYNAFVKAPYHKLISDNTRFWNASGLQVELTSEGISMNTGSLETLLSNGVTFGIPEGEEPGQPVTDRAYFDIHPDYDAAISPTYHNSVKYVMLVSDTVRGLTVGAPVEYRGIRIGKVLGINIDNTKQQDGLLRSDYKIPVLLAIEPGKVGLPDNEKGIEQISAQFSLWFKQGLRARLESGNLLTGKLFVELQHYPDEPQQEVSYFMEYPVIPSTLDDFGQLASKAADVLDKFNQLPLESLSTEMTAMASDFRKTAAAFKTASQNVTQLLSEVDKQSLVAQMNDTLNSFKLLAEGYSSGSQSHDQLIEAIENLNTRMQQLQPLLLQLNHKPNSLIFSDAGNETPVPRARR